MSLEQGRVDSTDQTRSKTSTYTTKLASQRTLLSYARTGLAIATAASAVRSRALLVTGGVLMCVSVVSYAASVRQLQDDRDPDDLRLVNAVPYVWVMACLTAVQIFFVQIGRAPASANISPPT